MENSQPQSPNEAPAPEGLELVLSCFETLRIQRAPITVETMDGVETEGHVESLDPAKGRMVLSIAQAPGRGLEADDEVDLYFAMQGNRWLGRAIVHYHDDRRRRFSLILPEEVGPADRRREQRVSLDTAENIKGLLSLSDHGGVKLHGRLSNLSENGFRITVEEAIEEETSRELDVNEVPMEEGQALDRVCITGLRSMPLETRGRIMDLDPNPLGVILGVRFKYLKAEDRQFLTSFVQARNSAAREKPTLVAPLPPSLVDSIEAALDSAETLRGGPSQLKPEERQESLKRLKKRFRTVVIAKPEGPERDALVGYLREEGFGKVLPVDTLRDLTELLCGSAVQLVIIDGGVAEMQGVELASFIHHAKDEQPCTIFLAEYEAGTNLKALASKAGVQCILKRPLLSPELEPILERYLDMKPGDVTALEDTDNHLQAPPGWDPRLKRFKTVALMMPPGSERERLQAFLATEGFTRVVLTGTVGELAKAVRAGALDMVLVDWPDPSIPELDIVKFLNSYPFQDPPKIVLACAQVTSHLAQEARVQAVTQLLVKPYALDSGFTDLLLSVLSSE